MKFGVLGTGMVGHALAGKLVSLGHEVMMGSRKSGNPVAVEWASGAGQSAHEGSFADATTFGEVVVNATAGAASLEVLKSVESSSLAGKVVIDVSNPLDFSQGMPPTLSICNDDSLAEQIQRACPEARVVKTLNTMNADVMVQPSLVAGEHTVFLSGDDADAKVAVGSLLREFGWGPEQVLDLGDLSSARGTEMFLPLWLRLWGANGSGLFNINVARNLTT